VGEKKRFATSPDLPAAHGWINGYNKPPPKKRKRKERSRNDGEREQTPDPLVNREKKERREKESFNLLSLVSDRLCAV